MPSPVSDPLPFLPLAVTVQGQGTPLLCLHGHPGSAACMTVFTNHLSPRFQTIAPDLRGYGQSRTQQPFTMQTHLTDLEALLDRLQIDRCLVLGWSLGGILALELALQFPDRVTGQILLATSARPRSNHPPVSWQDNLYTGLASLLNQVIPGWQWNIDTFGKRSLYRYLIQQHTPLAYQHIASSAVSAYLQTSPAAHQALQRALRQGYDRLPDLAQLTQPVLVLSGAADRHITAQSTLEMVHQLPQAEAICYPETAHLFPWEIPTQVLTDIDRWLAAHPELVR